MRPLQNCTAIVLTVAIACAGCTDKDRELARHTGDGSETFEFKPPKGSAPPNRLPSTDASSAPQAKPRIVPAKDSDGSDTFVFKRDPRTLPKAPPAAGK